MKLPFFNSKKKASQKIQEMVSNYYLQKKELIVLDSATNTQMNNSITFRAFSTTSNRQRAADKLAQELRMIDFFCSEEDKKSYLPFEDKGDMEVRRWLNQESSKIKDMGTQPIGKLEMVRQEL